jgi:hypothetical protein
MTITEFPSRSTRRPGRRRRPAPLLLRRQRHRRSRRPVVTADLALHALMRDGDLFKVGRSHYLVAPVSAELLSTLIEAQGVSEDAEDNGDLEASVESPAGDDRESDGLDDANMGQGAECTLGWAEEGSQMTLGCSAYEDEPELGWRNTGSQLPLRDRVTPWWVGFLEGDGDCDREHTLGWSNAHIDQLHLTAGLEGDPLDKGEFDPCDLGEPDHDDDGVDGDGGTDFSGGAI